MNPKCAFTDENFACANVEAITAGRLEELINATNFANRAEERILRALAAKVADSPNLGSLLRLERDLTGLVDAERKKLAASSQPELLLAGLTDDLFTSTRDLNAFFDQLAESIASRLDAFARDAGSSSHTAGEAAKGLRFLRLIQRRYNIVATNPPYLSNRKMNKRLATLMAEQYKAGKQDLYAAFILRCQELLAPQGLLGMLTMHSYMFIGGYENMRTTLRREVTIETLAHFGGGLFAVGNPGTLQTAAVVLRKETEDAVRDIIPGLFFRLVREPNSEAKRRSFEDALSLLRQQRTSRNVYSVCGRDFDRVPRSPWVYWATEKEANAFSHHQSLAQKFPIDMGLKTSGNARFVRFWWEIGKGNIEMSDSPALCRSSTRKWFRYAKGGKGGAATDIRNVVNWQFNGSEIKSYLLARYPYLNGNVAWCTHDESLYFHPAISWASVSSRGLTVKCIPAGVICSNANYAIFPRFEEVAGLYALLSSEPARYLTRLLCPTINHNKGDVALLPVPEAALQDPDILARGSLLMEVVTESHGFAEVSLEFCMPKAARNGGIQFADELLEPVNQSAFRLYGLDDRRDFVRDFISSNLLDESDGDGAGSDDDTDDEDESGESLDVNDVLSNAYSWMSYALGTVLGRYAIGEPIGLGRGDFDAATVAAIRALIDPDGVMLAEKGHPQDIVRRTVQCLEAMRGREAAHALIRTCAGEDSGDPEDLLGGWLGRFTGQPTASFWKYHYQLYRKRPIFWPLQSPKKHFTAWVCHERFGPTTLFTVKQLADDQCRLIEREITPLRAQAATSKVAAKKLDQLLEATEDLREFSTRLQTISNGGYTFCIDDGVLLNAAPLHPLLPSWPETKKTWKELEDEKYEWAQQAMKHWPDRVKEACKTNKSFAIAHGLA